jgi:23S rRNA pseudouridine1911/1915/1917 synthase
MLFFGLNGTMLVSLQPQPQKKGRLWVDTADNPVLEQVAELPHARALPNLGYGLANDEWYDANYGADEDSYILAEPKPISILGHRIAFDRRYNSSTKQVEQTRHLRWHKIGNWLKLIRPMFPTVGLKGVTAWIIPTPPFQRQVNRAESIMNAKQPPTSQFDLDAIEAFEAELENDQVADADMENDDDLVNNPIESVLTWTVKKDSKVIGKRLDVALASLAEVTRSMVGPWIADGHVTIDGIVVTRKATQIETGQVLTVCVPTVATMPTYIQAQDDLPLEILYEDEVMIVLNKAAGMVVHPAVGNWQGTVVNALAYYLPNQSPYGPGDLLMLPQNETEIISSTDTDSNTSTTTNKTIAADFWRPGIVHRLDKGTTGLLVVAKTKSALTALASDFAARRVQKTYLAITVGNPGSAVVIDKPIARHPVHRQRMRVVPNPHKHSVLPEDMLQPSTGKRALSYVDTLAFDGRLGLVQVKIATGRTHQIRVHLADQQTPIYGDDVYGRPDWNRRLLQSHSIERPLLHAFRLGIHHPVSGEFLEFEAPLPPDMQSLAKVICGPKGLPSFVTSSSPKAEQ